MKHDPEIYKTQPLASKHRRRHPVDPDEHFRIQFAGESRTKSGCRDVRRETRIEAIEILGRDNFTAQDREAAFRVLFTGSMDVKRIGIFALGQYARTPTPEEKTQYLALVEDFIVKVYASRLSDYTNQVFHVLGSQPKGRRGEEFIVSSQIEFENGREPVPVEWWLLKSEEGFRVFDVKVLGIWMAQEQRSAFISVIRNNNGNFSALLDHIQTRIGEADADIESKLTETDDTVESDDS